MINFNKEREIVILYTCGICNLNCRYCTIDKNPALKDIDDELAKSFEGDYYFNRIKEYFPRLDQLKSVETWGGEPFLHMERAIPLIHKLIGHYPYFKQMHSSTNFAFDGWVDKFMELMDVFAQHPEREFTYYLQLSIDGPEYINDANRGKGVTKKCIENFDKLMDVIKDGKFPKNVELIMTPKQTWDIDTIHKLDSKEKVIEYYKFYETAYMSKVFALNNDKIKIICTVPNMAMPSPITQADGKHFAELMKMCREIERENRVYKYFDYYELITPFSGKSCATCRTFTGDTARCGTGRQMVGFLPYNMISACHEGFTLLVDKYKDYAAQRSDDNLLVNLNKFFELTPTPMCLTDDEYALHERHMEYLNADRPVQMTTATIQIMSLAMAGLIEPEYLDEERALFAAKQVLTNGCFCIKVNYAMLGTFYMEPNDLYVLLLNGALKYLVTEDAK